MWKLLFPKRPTETASRHGRDGQPERRTLGRLERLERMERTAGRRGTNVNVIMRQFLLTLRIWQLQFVVNVLLDSLSPAGTYKMGQLIVTAVF